MRTEDAGSLLPNSYPLSNFNLNRKYKELRSGYCTDKLLHSNTFPRVAVNHCMAVGICFATARKDKDMEGCKQRK